jgi:hypothetical protein
MRRTVSKEIFSELTQGYAQQREAFESERRREEKFKKQLREVPQKPWQEYDEGLKKFEESFLEIVPFGFNDYLKKRFGERMGSLIGIELGGPGSKFFSEVQGFKRSLGITVCDLRDTLQSPEEKAADKVRNHSVMEGDVFQRDSVVEAKEWLRGEKADFIVERIKGGWGRNPLNMPLFAKSLSRWYELLGDRGTMILQNPFASTVNREREDFRYFHTQYHIWLRMFKQKYRGNLNILSGNYDTLKIEKEGNAPSKIEVLKF